MKVPGFLLRRLYVKGSLENVNDGFRFQIKNQLGSGYAKAIHPLAVDGKEVPLESSYFSVDGKEFSFAAVGDDQPFTLAMNKATSISVHGETLTPEPHTITMSFDVAGLGTLSFDFKDVPTDA